MWVTERISEFIEDWNSESDQFVDSFIENYYHGIMQITLQYIKFDRKHRIFSCLQVIIYYSVILYHLYLLALTSLALFRINFTLFTHNTHMILLTVLTTSVILSNQMNRKHFARNHRLMATGFFDYQEPELDEVLRLKKDLERQRRIMFGVPVLGLIAGSSCFLLSPLVDCYGTFDFSKLPPMTSTSQPYPYGIYFYDPNEGVNYYVTLVLQLLLATVIAIAIGMTGYSYIAISDSLIFQLRILLVSLDNLEKRAINLRNSIFGTKYKFSGCNLYKESEFVYCYDKCLRKNFQHHQVLIRYFNSLRSIFSVPIFLSYSFGTLVIALSLLCTGSGAELPGTTAAAGLLCIAEVGFMYLFSVIGQLITDLTMTQKPMVLMAGGIVPANMDSFAKVMNSAYSYYNVVNAFDI